MSDRIIGIGLGIILCSSLAILSIAISMRMKIDRKCLILGYPHAALDYKGGAFCIARVDGSDVVISAEIAPPLDQVEVK